MYKQKTIQKAVEMTGIGLHSGEKVHMVLHPAAADSGILFRRVDLSPVEHIPLRAEYIGETPLSTTLSNTAGVAISTIEHLLSAISALEIDNLIVDIDAREIPIVDGSAYPFIYLLNNVAGLQQQSVDKKWLKIKKGVTVRDGDKWATFTPYDGYRIDFEIQFIHPVIAATEQRYGLTLTPENYIHEISRARTFGLVSEMEDLQKAGLGLGAKLENTIAIGDFKILNHGGLRYPEEFVRHKILDAVGDLFVAGYSLRGHFSAYKSGHALNNRLMRTLLNTPDTWELVTL